MAGVKNRSGPPQNQNAFKHGLAGIQDRRQNGALGEQGLEIKQQILESLVNDKGGRENVSMSLLVLAEVIASDAAWLRVFDEAIDNVMRANQKARTNPKALSVLDGYKRTVANSLAANLARFGFEKVQAAPRDVRDLLPDRYAVDRDSPRPESTTENPPKNG